MRDINAGAFDVAGSSGTIVNLPKLTVAQQCADQRRFAGVGVPDNRDLQSIAMLVTHVAPLVARPQLAVRECRFEMQALAIGYSAVQVD